MKKVNAVLAILMTGVMMAGNPAWAHDGEVHADAGKATNGGQMQVAGPHHLELVVAKDSKAPRDNPVQVFVTDGAGKKLATAGATGTATLLVGKDKTVVPLAPDGDNRMKGMGTYASAAGMKAIVSITLPGQAAIQARFTPLAAQSDGHTQHTH